MSSIIINEVIEQLQTMPDTLQQEVLLFARNLKRSTIQGVPGDVLLQFAGAIPDDDLEVMRQAIASDCEQVDLNEW